MVKLSEKKSMLEKFRANVLKVQELGLQTAYSGDDVVYRYIRKIMALPFLLHREILPMFVRLEAQTQTEQLKSLVQYVRPQ